MEKKVEEKMNETQSKASIVTEKTTQDDISDRYIRLSSDFQNYKRNAEKKINSSYEEGRISMFNDLSEILNNIIRCNKSGHGYTKYLYENMISELSKIGIEPIFKKGDKFNPDLHEAVSYIQTFSGVESGCVSDCVSPGWKTKDGRIIQYCKAFVEE